MQEAVPAGEGAMAAILGLSPADVAEVCKKAAEGEVVSPANLNSPEQTVISGNAAAVKRAVEIASQSGAKRAVILPVSAPFHCAHDDAGAEAPGTGSARGEIQRAAFSGDYQCGRRSDHHRRRSARGADSPGDAAGPLARFDARNDRPGRQHLRRSRAGQSALRPAAADRSLGALLQRGRCRELAGHARQDRAGARRSAGNVHEASGQMFSLKDKVALVTGASQGIGRATSLALGGSRAQSCRGRAQRGKARIARRAKSRPRAAKRWRCRWTWPTQLR